METRVREECFCLMEIAVKLVYLAKMSGLKAGFTNQRAFEFFGSDAPISGNKVSCLWFLKCEEINVVFS